MLLAVDVGNTQTVIGMFERTELLQHWRLATRGDQTADEMALVFQGLLNQVGLSFDRNVSGVVISSVVPRVTQAMREMTERYFHFAPIVVGPGWKTGLAITRAIDHHEPWLTLEGLLQIYERNTLRHEE